MGTRNLTMVIKDGETKIAQYGQWDGYPGGQGATILDFFKSRNVRALLMNLKRCKFIDDAEDKEMDKFLLSIGVKDGWMNGEQSQKYHAKYPFLNRDHGAKILDIVAESECDVILLNDSTSFAGDSLMCEWAYVIDFDKNQLEVYSGFNKSPLPETDRFAAMTPERGYYAVRFIKAYSLDELPTKEVFCAELQEQETE